MLIRSLDPITDRSSVDAFFQDIADYVRLERDSAPGPEVTEEFFTDAPPGCDPAASHRLGLFDNAQLIAIAEMGMGFPTPDDAYIGFLAVSARARGRGAGAALLRHLETLARTAGKTSLFLAVLHANPTARAFWEREGFRHALTGSVTLGQKTQPVDRLGKPL